MKTHLRCAVSILVSHRTGTARQTTAAQALIPLSGSKMGTTTDDIISTIGKGIHWTGRKARLVLAIVTGMALRTTASKIDRAIE